MPIVIGKDPGGLGVIQDPEDVAGVTAEMVGGFLYARDNGAHVANLSAGSDYFRKTSPQHCGLRRIDIAKDEVFDTVVAELDAVVTASFSDIFGPTTLFTLSGGECGSTQGTVNDGIDEGASDDYYDWPSEAFFSNSNTRLVSITVAATDNDRSVLGRVATYSNFGEPFEIAAPGDFWYPDTGAPGSLCALNDTANCPGRGQVGTSFAAPAVAGVAGLIASGNPMAFGTPNAPVLKLILLNSHTIQDPTGLTLIPGNRGLTMGNLP
jgi:subtilisin family serine protease